MLSGAACSTYASPRCGHPSVASQVEVGLLWLEGRGDEWIDRWRELWPKRRKSRKVLRSGRNTGGRRSGNGRRRSASVGFGHERMRADGNLGDNDGGSD
jgi:hypothetical protein